MAFPSVTSHHPWPDILWSLSLLGRTLKHFQKVFNVVPIQLLQGWLRQTHLHRFLACAISVLARKSFISSRCLAISACCYSMMSISICHYISCCSVIKRCRSRMISCNVITDTVPSVSSPFATATVGSLSIRSVALFCLTLALFPPNKSQVSSTLPLRIPQDTRSGIEVPYLRTSLVQELLDPTAAAKCDVPSDSVR